MQASKPLNDLNSILLEGVLMHKPDLCEWPDNRVANFRLLTRRWPANGECVASYFEVECWGKLADYAVRCLDEGSRVRVVGQLKQYRPATGAPDTVKIYVEHIEPQAPVPITSTVSQEATDDL